jgi:hypothetical protein
MGWNRICGQPRVERAQRNETLPNGGGLGYGAAIAARAINEYDPAGEKPFRTEGSSLRGALAILGCLVSVFAWRKVSRENAIGGFEAPSEPPRERVSPRPSLFPSAEPR